MNSDDPIVEETRQAGEALFARFNHDLHGVSEYLRKTSEESRKAGREVVSFPPKRASAENVSQKRAG